MQALAETFLNDALASDFFAGGIALGLIGTALAVLRWGYASVHRLVWRRFSVSVEIDNRTSAFKHFCLWLDHSGVLSGARRLRVVQFPDRNRYEPDDDARAWLSPGLGLHWFIHGRVLCLIHRGIEKKARVESFSGMEGPLETIDVTVLGGGRHLVESWIAEGARIAVRRDRIGPAIHVLNSYNGWTECGDVPRRPLDTIAVEDGIADRVMSDVGRFYQARDWYVARGVPWRRGYLLYGPPGTGKSSLIRTLASELDRGIATVDLGQTGLSDDGLREAMVDAPARALLAIEDVDAVFIDRGNGERRSGVSFSGLLNAIDGVAAQEGRALFMTTNHRERLDPALIRPGRTDIHVELGPVGAAAARTMFLRFFPDEEQWADCFASAFGEDRRAPAEIQGWLMAHADAPEIAADARAFLAGERGLLAAE